MVHCIRLGYYSLTHHNANQSYDLGTSFLSNINLNVFKNKKNVMPRYRNKYFRNCHSLKLHYDVFLNNYITTPLITI